MTTTTGETAVITQVYRVYIKATPQAIWDAITKPEWVAKYGYGGTCEYDLRPGGAYRAFPSDDMRKASAEMGFPCPDVIVDGEVVEAEPPHKLVQTWRMLMDPEAAAVPPPDLRSRSGRTERIRDRQGRCEHDRRRIRRQPARHARRGVGRRPGSPGARHAARGLRRGTQQPGALDRDEQRGGHRSRHGDAQGAGRAGRAGAGRTRSHLGAVARPGRTGRRAGGDRRAAAGGLHRRRAVAAPGW